MSLASPQKRVKLTYDEMIRLKSWHMNHIDEVTTNGLAWAVRTAREDLRIPYISVSHIRHARYLNQTGRLPYQSTRRPLSFRQQVIPPSQEPVAEALARPYEPDRLLWPDVLDRAQESFDALEQMLAECRTVMDFDRQYREIDARLTVLVEENRQMRRQLRQVAVLAARMVKEWDASIPVPPLILDLLAELPTFGDTDDRASVGGQPTLLTTKGNGHE